MLRAQSQQTRYSRKGQDKKITKIVTKKIERSKMHAACCVSPIFYYDEHQLYTNEFIFHQNQYFSKSYINDFIFHQNAKSSRYKTHPGTQFTLICCHPPIRCRFKFKFSTLCSVCIKFKTPFNHLSQLPSITLSTHSVSYTYHQFCTQ